MSLLRQLSKVEQSKTARSWDSYRDTLYAVLDVVQPRHCFEWGGGLSTKILSLYPSVLTVDTVEHSDRWMQHFEITPGLENVKFHHVKLNEYASVEGENAPYDFIFVDGRRRFRCLVEASMMIKQDGVVMLHDAERWWYRPAIERFPYYLFTDDGSTVTMTHSNDTFSRIRHALSTIPV